MWREEAVACQVGCGVDAIVSTHCQIKYDIIATYATIGSLISKSFLLNIRIMILPFIVKNNISTIH
jgi:hypothetical protein